MKQSFANVTRDQLMDIAKRDNTTVMEHVYDYHEPWSTDRVGRVVDRIVALTNELGDPERVKAKVQEDEELREFSKTHPTMASKLAEPSIVNNEEHMKVIRFLLSTNMSLQQGRTTAQDAASDVAGFAMAALERQAKRSGGQTAEQSSSSSALPASRIEELD